MTVDLSATAGFPLALDPEAMTLETDGSVRFDRVARRRSAMTGVLFEPDGPSSTDELYWLFPPLDPIPTALTAAGLTYSCVLLPPLRVGREYVKTQGHYHPPMPGSDIAYPEVYTHLWGSPSLLLQRRSDERADYLDDCLLVELHAGRTVTIPPGYAHILINPSNQPAVIAGLYSPAFTPVYEPIARMAGAAYYLIDDGGERVAANPRYTVAPPLRRPANLTGTVFAPPDGDRPLWTSFLADPERYAFLSDPEAARRRFIEEALT